MHVFISTIFVAAPNRFESSLEESCLFSVKSNSMTMCYKWFILWRVSERDWTAVPCKFHDQYSELQHKQLYKKT